MRLLILLLIVSFAITGCSSVRSYTFQRERVDQDISEGNRGYFVGTPPAETKPKKFDKRTLVGVDIEVPMLPGEEQGVEVQIPPKTKKQKAMEPPKEEEKTFYQIPEEKVEPAKPAKPMKIKGEEVEEEWIK